MNSKEIQRKLKNAHQQGFDLGYLIATAHVARAGSETLAVEMMAECGIRHYWELDGKGLQRFDKSPLRRVLILEERNA